MLHLPFFFAACAMVVTFFLAYNALTTLSRLFFLHPETEDRRWLWTHIVESLTVPVDNPDLSTVGIVVVPASPVKIDNSLMENPYNHSSFYASIGERSTLGAVLHSLTPDLATVY